MAFVADGHGAGVRWSVVGVRAGERTVWLIRRLDDVAVGMA